MRPFLLTLVGTLLAILLIFLILKRNIIVQEEMLQGLHVEETFKLAPDSHEDIGPTEAGMGDFPIDSVDFQILGDLDVSYTERTMFLQSLGKDLSQKHIALLYDLLRSPMPKTERDRIFERAIRNDVMNVLRLQREPPTELTEVLASLYEDRTRDDGLRDYAIQHLAPWLLRSPPEDHGRILDVLWDASDERGGSIAGTAILGLKDLSLRGMGIDRDAVNEKALEISMDSSAAALSRVSAFQVAKDSSSRDLFSLAFRLGEDPTQPYALRISAIAVLASAPPELRVEAINLLDRLSDDNALSPAIIQSLSTLNQPLEP